MLYVFISDFSDIVRIEQNPSDDASTSQQEHRHYFRAVDLMQVSASSTSSSGNSSLSSRFHFVHPLPRRHRYIYPRDEEGVYINSVMCNVLFTVVNF